MTTLALTSLDNLERYQADAGKGFQVEESERRVRLAICADCVKAIRREISSQIAASPIICPYHLILKRLARRDRGTLERVELRVAYIKEPSHSLCEKLL